MIRVDGFQKLLAGLGAKRCDLFKLLAALVVELFFELGFVLGQVGLVELRWL